MVPRNGGSPSRTRIAGCCLRRLGTASAPSGRSGRRARRHGESLPTSWPFARSAAAGLSVTAASGRRRISEFDLVPLPRIFLSPPRPPGCLISALMCPRRCRSRYESSGPLCRPAIPASKGTDPASHEPERAPPSPCSGRQRTRPHTRGASASPGTGHRSRVASPRPVRSCVGSVPVGRPTNGGAPARAGPRLERSGSAWLG